MLVFIWNDWNLLHVARHGVTPEEAKEVAENARVPYPIPFGGEKWHVRGSTSSGRHLQVIYVLRPVADIHLESLDAVDRLHVMEVTEVAYIIHARELTKDEQRRSRKRRRR